MCKKVIILFLFILTIPHTHALDAISIGLRAGIDASLSADKFYSNGKGYRLESIFDGFNGGNPLSAGLFAGLFTNVHFNDAISIHLGVNALLFRQYREDVILPNTYTKGKQRSLYHSFDLDIITRLHSNSINGFYVGIGLGPTFNTKPKIISKDLNLNEPLKNGKSHLGLNILIDFGWDIPIGYTDVHFIQLGIRAAFDVIAFSQKQYSSYGVTIDHYAMMTPVALGFTVGYLYRFADFGSW